MTNPEYDPRRSPIDISRAMTVVDRSRHEPAMGAAAARCRKFRVFRFNGPCSETTARIELAKLVDNGRFGAINRITAQILSQSPRMLRRQ